MLQHLHASDLFLKAQTDERLAALCREGHTRAFAVLVDRHRRVLLGHACRMVGPERGEDVLQQALLRAWRSLQEGAQVRHAQAWLHRIVHNAALTEIEHQPRNVEPLDAAMASSASPASLAEQHLELVQVLQGLADLPQRERLALLGTELQGRSRRQLADELGLSEGAVRQLVYRARRRVRAGVAVLVPFPLVLRASRGWAQASDVVTQAGPAAPAAGGAGILAGSAVKVATVALAAGTLGGGALLHFGGGHPSRSGPPATTDTAAAASSHSSHTTPRPAGTLLALGVQPFRRAFPAGASSSHAAATEHAGHAPQITVKPRLTGHGSVTTPGSPPAPPQHEQPVATTRTSTPSPTRTVAISEPTTTTDASSTSNGSQDSGSTTSSDTTTAPSSTTAQTDQVDTSTVTTASSQPDG